MTSGGAKLRLCESEFCQNLFTAVDGTTLLTSFLNKKQKQAEKWAATGKVSETAKQHKLFQLCGKQVCAGGMCRVTGISSTTWTARTKATAEEFYTEMPHGNKVRTR